LLVYNSHPREVIVFGLRHDSLESAEAVAVETGHQQAAGTRDKPFTDTRDLRGRLTRSQHDLGQRVSEATVVVKLGKAQVFVRKMAQVCQCRINTDGACSDLLQQQFQLLVDSNCLRNSLTDYSIGGLYSQAALAC
jgi:hypothetical protein